MKESVLRAKLKKILPTAKIAFDGEAELPYIVYYPMASVTITADDAIAAATSTWRIELYSEREEPQAEKKIRAVLRELELIYKMDRAYIAEEQTLVTYFIFTALEEAE